jgi:hypothetical protein
MVVIMSVDVIVLPEADDERRSLARNERLALDNAIEKLKAIGDQLDYPHSSNVRCAQRLRELRPRGGRSPWRALYRRVGAVFVIAAIGPEAQVDSRGFDRAVVAAEQRLSIWERETR